MLELYAAMQVQDFKQQAAGAWVAEAQRSNVAQATPWISEPGASDARKYAVSPGGETVAQSKEVKVLEGSNPAMTSFISSAHAKSSHAVGASASAQISDTASRRIRILAVQYASSKPVKEVQARLEILDARMNNYSPRVSGARRVALNEAKAVLDASQDALAEIDKILGV